MKQKMSGGVSSTAKFLPVEDQQLSGSGGGSGRRAVEEDYLCGIGSWQPPHLQVFANVKVFATNLALINFTYIMFFTYFIGVLTTMEKRFEFPSKSSGLLMAFNDITHLLFIIGVSHFAGNRRRPFFIGVASLCFSLGILMFALPHFIYGARSDGLDFSKLALDNGDGKIKEALELCNASRSDGDPTDGSDPSERSECQEESMNDNKVAFALMCIAELLIGTGTSTIFPLGVSYMDDNVKSKVSPMYMSFFLAARTCGPVFGFIFSALCTSVYVDLSDPPLSKRDPRWIGAWWLGYIVIGTIMLLASVPMLFYPKHLPTSQSREKLAKNDNQRLEQDQKDSEREMQVVENNVFKSKPAVDDDDINGESKEDEGEEMKRLEENARKLLLKKPKELLKAIYKLLTNPVYLCITLGTCANLYTIVSLKMFMPKYLEQQFGVTTAMASMYTGIVGVVSATVGLITGGFVIKKLRVQTKGAIVITIVGTSILLLGIVINMFLGCPNLPLAAKYQQTGDNSIDFRAHCDSGCECSVTQFSPVCGADGLNYFSACGAGCSSSNLTDCSCIPGNGTAAASSGYCDRGCDYLFPYLAVIFISGLAASPAGITNLMVQLRCVKKEEKAIALGFSSFVMSVVTWLPGPIIAGTLVDTACLYWQVNKCGESGSCWIYDNRKFRYVIHGFAVAMKVIALALYGTALYKCPGPYVGSDKNTNPTENTAAEDEKNVGEEKE